MKKVRPKEGRWLPEITPHELTESRIYYFSSAIENMSIERKDSARPITYLRWHPLKEMKLINLSFRLNNLTHTDFGSLIWI